MKILFIKHKDFIDVMVHDDKGFSVAGYTFDTMKEANAFFSGFTCAKTLINGMVQSLSNTYTILTDNCS